MFLFHSFFPLAATNYNFDFRERTNSNREKYEKIEKIGEGKFIFKFQIFIQELMVLFTRQEIQKLKN